MVGAAPVYQAKKTRETDTETYVTGWYQIDHVSDTKQRSGWGCEWCEQKGVDYESEWEVLCVYFTRIRAACLEETTDVQIYGVR